MLQAFCWSSPPPSAAFNIEAVARSRAIQAELQRIDTDRGVWVDALLTEWDWVLDPAVYDVRSELTAIAMKAPAWQLYAASLVGTSRRWWRPFAGREAPGRS